MGRQKAPVKILIVDDREDNHLALQSIWEGQNYRFFHALSGKEALRILLKETDFTLIILDVVMPGMDGFETASYISKRNVLRNIPIIFLTAKDSENQVFRAFESGAVDYISKPVVPELLRAKVDVFIELRQKNKALELQRRRLKETNERLRKEVKERKASEARVIALNSELSARLKELEELDAFSYSIAHDFQSPLNSISMIAHMLLKDPAVASGDGVTKQIKKIEDQVLRLNNLINDLLLFSHQENVVEKQPVDMKTIVEGVVEDLRSVYQVDGRYTIQVDHLPTVSCSEGLIKQVWTNLLSNAIKYSREKEKPKIRVASSTLDDHTVYSISDNGIGFLKEDSEGLFKIFQRSAMARDFEGTGVGLAIVKRIIEKHGGQIWATSVPDSETTFSFYLE